MARVIQKLCGNLSPLYNTYLSRRCSLFIVTTNLCSIIRFLSVLSCCTAYLLEGKHSWNIQTVLQPFIRIVVTDTDTLCIPTYHILILFALTIKGKKLERIGMLSFLLRFVPITFYLKSSFLSHIS